MCETDISYSETPIWDPETYDAPRRRLVPDFDCFYGTAAELVADLGVRRPRVLDLGAGTGILSGAVRAAVPAAELTLLDGAAPMLAVARHRLGEVATVTADLTDPLPTGPFDAVVSALAIHHLSDEAKRDLFTRVVGILRPGGVFVNAEQVAGATPWHRAQYEAAHERDARALGTDDAEWDAALGRMAHDRCAPVEDQLAWLAAAGFERTDLVFKRYGFAVYAGFAPGSADGVGS
ncbi:MAG: Methyltransferase [Acidimicrobiales bacterium]|nr:Methyltransferase [Acidimicrobiales bacterium]